MSDEIFFDGLRFVTASEAAELVGLTSDYVARLSKEGKLQSRRVGKQWYVDPLSLKEFAVKQEQARVSRREELAQIRKSEYRNKTSHTTSQHTEEVRPETHVAPSADIFKRVILGAPHHSHLRAAQALASAPLHAVSLKAHASAQALPPALDLFHKFIAATIVALFTAGTFVLVDAQYTRVAERPTPIAAEMAHVVQAQLAAAAADPQGTFAGAVKNIARAFNTGIDSLVYRIMFPSSIVYDSRAKVVARIIPKASPVSSTVPSIETTVIERIIETERLVLNAGGLTEEILDAKLEEFRGAFVSRVLFDAQVDATHRSIESSRRSSGGGASISTPIDVTDGGTGISTAPSYGQVLLGNTSGGYDLVATSSLGIAGSGFSASSTLLTDDNTFSGVNAFQNITASQATTSNLAITSITDAIAYFNADGSAVEYQGTSCTNQFVRSLNGAGVATCASVDLANDVTGTLAANRGGTGTSTPGALGDVLSWNGTNWQGYATSTLGLPTFTDLSAYALTGDLANYFSLIDWYATTTDGLAEGDDNWYYTENRFTSSLAATTSVASIESLPNLSITESQISDLTHYTDDDANLFIAGSSTIPKTYTANTFSGDNIFSNTITGSISGNAGTATALETARTINGVSFDGTQNITIAAASSTLLADNNMFSGTNAFANITASQATTSNLAITSITDAIAYFNADGSAVEYQGTSCTNQFVRSLNGAGVATCASVDLANDVTGTLAASRGGTGQSSFTTGDILYASGPTTISKLGIGIAGQVLKVSGGGVPQWGLDLTTGGGGGSGAWATTTDNLAIYPTDPTNVVIIGDSATSSVGNILEVVGNTLFRNDVAISGTASTTDLTISSAPNGLLVTDSEGFVSAFSGTSCTNQFVRSLNGAGVATCATVDLASDVTGTLAANRGGTGTSTPGALGDVLSWNGTNWQGYATSTLGLPTFTDLSAYALTGDLANYLTQAAYFASTTPQHITSLPNLSITESQISDLTHYTDDDANLFIAGSSTIPKTYTENVFTGANTFSQTITGSVSGNAGTATALQTARTINDVSFDGTQNITITAASSTLLANNNTFSGNNIFSNTITGSISGNAGTVTNGVYTTDTGSVTNTMLAGSIANDKLLNSSITINGTSIALGSSDTVFAASSTLLANNNTFSGFNAFTGDTTLSNATSSTFAITSLATAGGAFLAVNADGTIIATSTPVNGSMASSTLLADDNTWGGLQTFMNTGTTTFAGGIDIADGCFSVNGTCIGAGGGGGGSGGARLVDIKVYEAGGSPHTWTKPDNLDYVVVELVGGGGGGGGSGTAATARSGGAAGGYSKKRISAASLGTTETATVGAGGSGGAAGANNNGDAGVASTFGTHLEGGGGGGSQNNFGGSGGTASGGDINIQGGGGGGPTGVDGVTGIGGSSYFGGGGRGRINDGVGQPGLANGSGGAGARGNFAGGDGGSGIVIVYEYAQTDDTQKFVESGDGTIYLANTTHNFALGTSTAYSRLSVWGDTTGNIFEAITSASSSALTVSGTGFGTTTLTGLNIAGSATSTSNVGFNITGGCFAVNGTCIGGGGGSSFGKTFEIANNIFSQSSLSPTTTLNLAITGTGTSTFAGGLEAWRQIAAPYFHATSTTATSTFAGNVQVDGQLKVGTGSIYLNGNSTSTFSAGIQTAALNVNGSATSTFTNGIRLAGGCVEVNGSCIGSGGGGGAGGGQLLAVYATSSVGTSTVNFLGSAGANPSFSGTTLTLPSNTSYIVVEVWGGGGGGGSTSGGIGGTSNFGGVATSTGGGNTTIFGSTGGVGGVGSGGDINLQGGAGANRRDGESSAGGSGARGGGGAVGTSLPGSAFGGGGGGNDTGAGGGGGYTQKLFTTLTSSYQFVVGRGGAAGGAAGSAGGTGGIVIYVYTTGISNGSLASGTAGQFAFWNAAGTNLSATSSLFVGTNSFIGIGTTSPGSILSVQGVGNFVANATSTFTSTGGGINLTTGCFAVNGTCVGGGGGSSASTTLLSDNNTFSGNNIFSSLARFTSGLLSLASTTIGDGTQAGGLTISGGATTTGNAYFGGDIASIGYDGLVPGFSLTSGGGLDVVNTSSLLSFNENYFAVQHGGSLLTYDDNALEILLNAGDTQFLVDGDNGNFNFTIDGSGILYDDADTGNITFGANNTTGLSFGSVLDGGSFAVDTAGGLTLTTADGATLTFDEPGILELINTDRRFAVSSQDIYFDIPDKNFTFSVSPSDIGNYLFEIRDPSAVFIVGNGGDLSFGNNAGSLYVANDGFGTTTVSGLTIDGSATSTSNVGWNITGGCYAVNGVCIGGGSGSSASSTLLADNNTFSGTNIFSNTITGNVSGNAGTATALQTPRLINSVSFDGTADITIFAASSTLLANNNTWSGLNQFTNATTTLLSGSTAWFTDYIGSGAGLTNLDGGNIQSGTVGEDAIDFTSITLNDFVNDADFVKWASATSSLWQSAGLFSTASSTIGGGTQATGLTIFGGATTTGNAYFGGNAIFGSELRSTGYPNEAGFRISEGKLYLTGFDGGTASLHPQTGFLFSHNGDDFSLAPAGFNLSFGEGGSLNFDDEGNLELFGAGDGMLQINSNGWLSLSTGDGSSLGFDGGFYVSNAGMGDTLVVSSLGFGTTTVTGLNVNGSATSTSNVGFNITGGCFAVNGTCVGGGGGSSASTTLLSDNNTFSGVNAFQNITASQATTSNLAITSITDAIAYFNADGSAVEYQGTSCTNQFVRSLNGAGVATCASIQQADLNLSDITLADFTNDADFVKWANATSSLWQSAGLFSTASSTIGGGTQATGLTIFGGATTTGNLAVQGTGTSTFAGNMQVDGILKVGTDSIYLNGNSTSTFSAGIQSTALNLTGSATSTFAQGIDLAGGCFSINGECIGGGAGTISGGGQAGRVAFWDGDESLSSNAGFLWDNDLSRLTVANASTTNLTASQLWITDGLMHFTTAATTTVVDNNPYAWVIATSTDGRPLFRIDTTSGAESVTLGSGYSGEVIIGDVGESTDLVFEENASIRGQTGGRVITLGSADDTINIGTSATSTFTAGIQSTALNLTGSATSTAANGFDLAGGCYAVNGVCVGSSSASTTLLADNNTFSGNNTFSQTITGSVSGNAGTATALETARTINGVSFDGTQNITIAAASSTLLANNNTWTGGNLFLASSTIGGGTQATGLTIFGGATTTGNQYVAGTLSTIGATSLTNGALTVSGSGFGTTTVTGLNINGSATSTSNVGFNITSGCFAVNGACVGGANPGGSTGQIQFNNAGSLGASASLFWDNTNARLGVGSSTPWAKLAIHALNGETNTTLFAIASSTASATTTLFAVSNSGNVGIGTESPSGKLEVVGDIISRGTSWTARSVLSNNDSWAGVAYGNGMFVAVSGNGDRVATSPDGINWTARSAAGDDDVWTSVTYGSGLFVAVGNSGNRIITSPDGINWTARSAAGDDDSWTSVTYGNGTFVAVSDSGNRVITSQDGITWTTQSVLGENDGWNSVTYGNGIFVAVADSGDRVMTSSDGVNWSAQSAAGDDDSWESVVYGNGTFVAVGSSGNLVMTSPDGVTWTAHSVAGDNDTWQAVTYGDGLFVAVGNSADRVITSPDGINWTVRSAAGNNDEWEAVTYGNGIFVAVGDSGDTRVMTSGKMQEIALAYNNIFQGATSFMDQLRVGTTTSYSKFAVWGGSTGNVFEAVTSASSSALTVSGTGFGTTTVTGLNINGSATSTSNVGFNIASGCYAVNGTCLGGGGATPAGSTGQLQFNSAGALGASAQLYWDSSNSRLGVGTSTPYAKLSVWGAGTGTGTLFELANNASTTVAKFLDNGTGYFLGSIGIGTTSPFRKLSVTDAVTTAQAVLAYDGTRYTDLLTNAVGDLVINPQGDDAFLNDDNLWVCTGGSCPSGNPTGTGNLVVENKVGIGTTTPRTPLHIEGSDPKILVFDNDSAMSSSRPGWAFGQTNANFVVGTTSNYSTFGNVLSITPNTSGAAATSTFVGDVLITGKLDVSTIDPVYTIDGVKYATYGHSTIGVKEEMAMVVEVSEKNAATGKYEYAIDFDTLPFGSDPWLFWQVTNFGKDWKKLIVAATPGFDGTVHYEKDEATNTLRIVSTAAGEVSLRLIADRYDAPQWPNLRPDQGEGFEGHVIQGK